MDRDVVAHVLEIDEARAAAAAADDPGARAAAAAAKQPAAAAAAVLRARAALPRLAVLRRERAERALATRAAVGAVVGAVVVGAVVGGAMVGAIVGAVVGAVIAVGRRRESSPSGMARGGGARRALDVILIAPRDARRARAPHDTPRTTDLARVAAP